MRSILLPSVFLAAFAVPLFAADRSVDPMLWYRHPAQTWGDALPVGNGRLGAMVFGGIVKERIQLNEDTIWNGKKRDRINPGALEALPEVRRLLFEKKVSAAEALEDQKMVGIPHRQPPNRPRSAARHLRLLIFGHKPQTFSCQSRVNFPWDSCTVDGQEFRGVCPRPCPPGPTHEGSIGQLKGRLIRQPMLCPVRVHVRHDWFAHRDSLRGHDHLGQLGDLLVDLGL